MTADGHKKKSLSSDGKFFGWDELAKSYDAGSTEDKFNCFILAISQAIEMLRQEGKNPRVPKELLLQLMDKRDGFNTTLLDFTADGGANAGKPVKFSTNLKKANASAAVDAYMAIGMRKEEAGELIGNQLSIPPQTVLRWRKEFRENEINHWSEEYRRKISNLKGRSKKETSAYLALLLSGAK